MRWQWGINGTAALRKILGIQVKVLADPARVRRALRRRAASDFPLGSETFGQYYVTVTSVAELRGYVLRLGRVSRQGCMSLSWSMDKLGPICRSAEDCALVFQAIHGADGLDPSAVDRPFHWPVKVNMKRISVGYVDDGRKLADREALQVFKGPRL